MVSWVWLGYAVILCAYMVSRWEHQVCCLLSRACPEELLTVLQTLWGPICACAKVSDDRWPPH